MVNVNVYQSGYLDWMLMEDVGYTHDYIEYLEYVRTYVHSSISMYLPSYIPTYL